MTQIDLQKLLRFFGYGTLNAPLWFIGMEEAFTERANFTHDNNLRVRCGFSEVMDIQNAHQHLKAEYWKANKLKVSSVWHWMSKLALALLHGDGQWSDGAKIAHYIRYQLGRDQAHGGETFLIELLPLPKRNVSDWPTAYQTLFPSRRDYENTMRDQRSNQIRELIGKHQPKYVICYGTANYPYYQAIVGTENWQEKPLSGTKFWIKRLDKTYVVLSPFFGNGALSTNSVKTLIQYITT